MNKCPTGKNTAVRWSTPNHTDQPTPAGCSPVEVVGQAEDGAQAVEQMRALHADVVVMDLLDRQTHTVFAPEFRRD